MEPLIRTEIRPRMGELVIATELHSPLPLEKTVYTGQILGPVATITVNQHFVNPLEEAAELEYLFPLSHKAAIIDFKLTVGARTIRADLMEVTKAQREYEQARLAGRRAGLMEQRRPNLFAVRLANVQPGDNLQASISYQERLKYDSGTYELVIPMGITPRYHSPEHLHEGKGLDAPIAGADEPVGGLEIILSVDAGLPAGDPIVTTHPIEVTRLDERRFNLRLAGPQIPDHDFVLRYPVFNKHFALAAWRASGEDGDYFLATLLPPDGRDQAVSVAREFIFVLDRSGSMMGEPIRQAVNALRACLRTLTPSDRFRLLLFNQTPRWYQGDASPFSQESLDQVDHFLAQVEGTGGTEIVGALSEALSLPADKERTRLVILFTDGAVSAEERAYKEVNRLLGKARLFTFGIGPSVNRAFLEELARAGRGTAEFVDLTDDIEGAIIRFNDRLSFPALTDLKITDGNSMVWDVYPSPLRDIYHGQPLEIVGRMVSENASRRLVVEGRRDSEKVIVEVDLPPASQPEPAIARLWARARLDDLLAQEAIGVKGNARDLIINLALKHRLVTPYTAFFARDEEIVGAEEVKPRLIVVSQPLPPGLRLEGFFGPAIPGEPAMVASRGDAPESPAKMKVYCQGLTDESEYLPVANKLDLAMPTLISPALITLRWLARTQRANGSWDDDVETTAAALLAFVRHGHTTAAGDFRRRVERAFTWLLSHPGSGFASSLRALAFHELAEATQLPAHRQAAAEAAQQLPQAADPLERAINERLSGKTVSVNATTGIDSIDDLRRALLFPGKRIARIEDFMDESSSVLEQALAAAAAPD
jgi:Ca-activated chloride channel family protein